MQVIDLRKDKVSKINRKLKDACLAVYQDMIKGKGEEVYTVSSSGYPYSIIGRDNMGVFGISISRSADQTLISQVSRALENMGATFVDVEMVFTMSALNITDKTYLRLIDEDGTESDLMFFGFSEVAVIAMKDGEEIRTAVTDIHIGKDAIEVEDEEGAINQVERARFIVENEKKDLVLLCANQDDPYYGVLTEAEKYEEIIAKTYIVESEYISDLADAVNERHECGIDIDPKVSAVLLSAPDGIMQFLELPKEEPYVMLSVSTTLQ